MLCAKCGEQTTLVNNYKLEVDREKSTCTKYTEVVQQLDSVRYVTTYVSQSNDASVASPASTHITGRQCRSTQEQQQMWL